MQLGSSSEGGAHNARLNRLIQLTLISGLSISMLLMITGTILHALHYAAGLATMVLGMIVLMITPALRVAVATLGYLLDRDWLFALISAGVLLVLIVSLVIGAA